MPSPLEAVLLGAGSAASAGLDGAAKGYYKIRGALALDDSEQLRYAGLLSDLSARRAIEGDLYRPVREAYPYLTRAGESLPAFLGGITPGLHAVRLGLESVLLDELSSWLNLPRVKLPY